MRRVRLLAFGREEAGPGGGELLLFEAVVLLEHVAHEARIALGPSEKLQQARDGVGAGLDLELVDPLV